MPAPTIAFTTLLQRAAVTIRFLAKAHRGGKGAALQRPQRRKPLLGAQVLSNLHCNFGDTARSGQPTFLLSVEASEQADVEIAQTQVRVATVDPRSPEVVPPGGVFERAAVPSF